MVVPSPRALVALTREPPKNEPLDALLTARSIPTVHLPCVARLDGPDLPALPAALASPPQPWAWVVVTSPEAASIVVEAYAAAGRPSPPPRLAAVGDATSRVLTAAGLPVSFVPSVATGAVLVAELPSPPPPALCDTPAAAAASVLYPASMRAGSGVADGLTARGYAVIAACIGETSAKAARAAGFGRVMAAAEPGLDAWADVVEEAVDVVREEVAAARGGRGGH